MTRRFQDPGWGDAALKWPSSSLELTTRDFLCGWAKKDVPDKITHTGIIAIRFRPLATISHATSFTGSWIPTWPLETTGGRHRGLKTTLNFKGCLAILMLII